MNISAFIFAAGLGTRLYPLTETKPKALIDFKGKTLLEIVIQNIIKADIHHIIINIHHFPDQIINFLNQHSFDAKIELSDERDELKDTAGGLKFAEPLLSDSDIVLLHNVDIISNINLNKLITYHLENGALATLAVQNRSTTRKFIFDQQQNVLCGWTNLNTKETIWTRETQFPIQYAFSGIHVVNKSILSLIPNTQKRSFTPFYLEIAKNHDIKPFIHPHDQWMDIGKYEDYKKLIQQ